MQAPVPTCKVPFLSMQGSVPTCKDPFRRIGVSGAGDVIVTDDGSSGEVVSVVSVAVREVGHVVLVMSTCRDVSDSGRLTRGKYLGDSEMFDGCSG